MSLSCLPSFDINDVEFGELRPTGNIKFSFVKTCHGDVLELKIMNATVSKIWEGGKASLWVSPEVYNTVKDIEASLLDLADMNGERKSICRNHNYISVKIPDELKVVSQDRKYKPLNQGMSLDVAVQITGAWQHNSTGHGLSMKAIAARENPKQEYDWGV